MHVDRAEEFAIRDSNDVPRVRQAVRQWSVDLGFSIVEQTRIVTAASELARNTLNYGRGGICIVEQLDAGSRRGLRLRFEDKGPGIVDVSQAVRDGFSTGVGLGLGLGGAKRLMHEFEIESRPGEGTRVTVVRWKS